MTSGQLKYFLRLCSFLLVAMLVAGMLPLPLPRAEAATTGNLVPVNNGGVADTGWLNKAGTQCITDGTNCFDEVNDTPGSHDGNDTYVEKGGQTNLDITFDLNISSIPNGSTITAVSITIVCARVGGNNTSNTQSVRRIDGTLVASGTNFACPASGVYNSFTQNHTGLNITKTSGTDFEIGVRGVQNRAIRVTAIYADITYTPPTFTLTVNVTGQGSVSKNPDKAQYDLNESVELTANPDAGWQFKEWEGDLTGTENPKSIIMNSDKTVTAVFEEIPPPPTFTLTVNVTGQGSVAKNPDKQDYDENESVELTAIPASGWQFVNWSGDLSGSTNPETIIMNSNKTVTAVFEEDSEPPEPATWRKPEDTPDSVKKNQNIRLRMQISNDGNISDTATFRLDYAESPAGPWTAVPVDASCSSTAEHFRICSSSYFTNQEPTTRRLSELLGAIFVPGFIMDASNPAPSITLETEEYTELEWNIQATNSAQGGGTYYFRVSNSESIGTYSVYPELVVETDAPVLRQNYFRWFEDNGQLTPENPWSGLGENASITSSDSPPATGNILRLRMSIKVTGAALLEQSQSFTLEYGQRDSTCGAISEWQAVGGAGSSEIWRGVNTGPADGTALSGNPPTGGDLLLSVSDRAGTYERENNSATNPYRVEINEDVEYDWILQHNGAIPGATYCIRMTRADNGPLDWYDFYPVLVTASYAPETMNWRWYADADNETPTEPLTLDENEAPADIRINDVIKLRITVIETMGIAGENVKFRLQFSENSNFSGQVEYVEEIGSCVTESVWCYADGGGDDNAVITTSLLSDADSCMAGSGNGCGTHNESGISASTFIHPAGAAVEYEFTIKQAGAPANVTYFFRLFDTVRGVPVLKGVEKINPSASTGGTELEFTIAGVGSGITTEGVTTDVATTPVLINFDTLPFDTPLHAAQRKIISTNAANGYQIFIYRTQGFMNDKGEEIPGVVGTNETPLAWNSGCEAELSGCFGYHAGDDVLAGGSTRFAPHDTYARIEDEPKEIAFASGPVTDKETDIVFQLQVTGRQQPGNYASSLGYIVVPIF